MKTNKKYQLGLFYMVHLLINVDGMVDEKERAVLSKIKTIEKIPDSVFHEFESEIARKKEREIYHLGIEMLNACSKEEKLTSFVHLYKMSEADGRVHVKEVRLLLYSIRQAGIEFDDVVRQAKQLNSY